MQTCASPPSHPLQLCPSTVLFPGMRMRWSGLTTRNDWSAFSSITASTRCCSGGWTTSTGVPFAATTWAPLKSILAGDRISPPAFTTSKRVYREDSSMAFQWRESTNQLLRIIYIYKYIYIYLGPKCPSNLEAVSTLHPFIKKPVNLPNGRISAKGRSLNIVLVKRVPSWSFWWFICVHECGLHPS